MKKVGDQTSELAEFTQWPLFLAIFFICLAALPAFAQSSGWDVTKTVTWGGYGTNWMSGAAKGTYDWKIESDAKHESCHKHQEAEQLPTQFFLTNGIDWLGDNVLANCTAAWASSQADVRCGGPVVSNKNWTITGKVSAISRTTVQEPQPKGQTADSSAEAHLKVSIGELKFGEVQFGTNTIDLILSKDTSHPQVRTGHPHPSDTNKWSDPVQIQLREIETGRTNLEDLVHLTANGVGVGDWTWTTNGLSISAPDDGVSSISISGSFPSTWIVSSPGDFVVQLTGGHFQATGSFATLPWVFTTVGGVVVSAALPVGALPPLRVAYVVPGVLLHPTNTYEETLQYDSVNVSHSACCEGTSLAISTLPGGILVSWPADVTNAVLERADSLVAPNWVPVQDPPALVDGRFLVFRPAGLPEEFFRLRVPVVPCVLNITGQPGDLIAFDGALLYFSVAAEGSPVPATYQWQSKDVSDNFVDIPGATDAAYVRVVTLADDGLHLRCVVGNGCALVPSAVAVLTVQN